MGAEEGREWLVGSVCGGREGVVSVCGGREGVVSG